MRTKRFLLPFLSAACCTWAVATAMLLPVGGTAGNPVAPTVDGEVATTPKLELPNGCVLTARQLPTKRAGTTVQISVMNPTDEKVDVGAVVHLLAPKKAAMVMSRMLMPLTKDRSIPCPLIVEAGGIVTKQVPLEFLDLTGAKIEVAVGELSMNVFDGSKLQQYLVQTPANGELQEIANGGAQAATLLDGYAAKSKLDAGKAK